MSNAVEEARSWLDYALFHNVENMPDSPKFEVTFEGDNYVLWNTETDELFHFVVEIREQVWDSEKAREDQEWDI